MIFIPAAAVGAEKRVGADKVPVRFYDCRNPLVQSFAGHRFGQILGHTGVAGFEHPLGLAKGGDDAVQVALPQ